MLNKIYIHYITTLFVLESFIISCWLLKGKKIGIGIGIGQFARKKSVSESATKNHDRCITSLNYDFPWQSWLITIKLKVYIYIYIYIYIYCMYMWPWTTQPVLSVNFTIEIYIDV